MPPFAHGRQESTNIINKNKEAKTFVAKPQIELVTLLTFEV